MERHRKHSELSHFYIKAPPPESNLIASFQQFLGVIQTPPPEAIDGNLLASYQQFLEVLRKSLESGSITFRLVGKDGMVYCIASVAPEFDEQFLNMLFTHFPSCEVERLDAHIIQPRKFHFISKIKTKRSKLVPILSHQEIEGDSISAVCTALAKIKGDSIGWIELTYAAHREDLFFMLTRRLRYRLFRLGRIFRLRDKQKPGLFERESAGIERKLGMHPVMCGLEIGLTSDVDDPSFLDNLKYLLYSFYGAEHTNRLVASPTISPENLASYFDDNVVESTLSLSIEEASTLIHLPKQQDVPTFSAVVSRKTEPPPNLPCDSESAISYFGETNYHNNYRRFGIKRGDRRRHLYVIGKSGSGKSKLLELLIQDDLRNGHGLCVIDPHGDLVEGALDLVPEERRQDIVIFDPTSKNVVPFNPLESVDESLRLQVTNSFVSIFKKAFASDWNPRLEHVLRYAVFALLETKDATIFSIQQLLTNRDFRQIVIRQIRNESVKNFWTNEFPSWTEKYNAEAINPLLNKIGQLVSSGMIRTIISVPKNTFNIRDIMDQGKVLLIKLPKGILGEENIQLLGAMFITKIYQAAMSRQDIPENQRRNFYLYVDEFQNFATDTFSEILSEARKYGLNLTLAHQFLGQLTENIKKTVFGNVGSLVSFRVGGEDAKHFVNEYTPMYVERDLINLGVREFYAKMTIDGEIRKAFSGRTLFLTKPSTSFREEIVAISDAKFSVNLDELKKQRARRALIDSGTILAEDIPIDDELQKRPFPEPLDHETAQKLYSEWCAMQADAGETPVRLSPLQPKLEENDWRSALNVLRKFDRSITMLDLEEIASRIRQAKSG
jgi:DNA helicase HerA-like ATPase